MDLVPLNLQRWAKMLISCGKTQDRLAGEEFVGTDPSLWRTQWIGEGLQTSHWATVTRLDSGIGVMGWFLFSKDSATEWSFKSMCWVISASVEFVLSKLLFSMWIFDDLCSEHLSQFWAKKLTRPSFPGRNNLETKESVHQLVLSLGPPFIHSVDSSLRRRLTGGLRRTIKGCQTGEIGGNEWRWWFFKYATFMDDLS